MIWTYLIFGVGFYIGMALKNPEGFIKASSAALIRGLLLGVFFWPIGLIIQLFFAIIVIAKDSK